MSRKITISLDAEDMAIVGATLRILGKQNKSPDITVGARLTRVGEAMVAAVAIDTMFASVEEARG